MLNGPYTPGLRQGRAIAEVEGPYPPPPEDPGALVELLRRATMVQVEISDCASRLMQVADRSFGPVPMAATAGKEQDKSQGVVTEIHIALDRANSSLNWLRSEIDRIERL